MGESCLNFFTYSGFCILSWPWYQSSLHSVCFSLVWVTSFAWQFLDVLPEFISGSFMSLSLTSMHVCLHTSEELTSYQGFSKSPPILLNSLSPSSRKIFIFQVLDLLQTPFTLPISLALTNLILFLHGMQSSLRFCNPFSL